MEETKPLICEDSEDNKSCTSPGSSPSDQQEGVDRTEVPNWTPLQYVS